MEASRVSLSELLALQHPARHYALARLGLRRLQAGGGHLPRLRGRGMAFEEHRVYQPGDEQRFIDWRVTARTGQMHVKVFREEHERPVHLLLDLRAGMAFGSRFQFKSRLAAQACALLGWTAVHDRERVGGLVLGEALQETPVRSGVHGLLPWAQLAAAAHGGQPGPSLARAVAHLRRTARPGALVVLASDFADLDEDTAAALADIARHCQLILLSVQDPLEAAPPAAELPFRDAAGQTRWLDLRRAPRRQAWQRAQAQRRERIARLASRARAIWLPLETPLPAQEQLAPHLGRRR